MKLILAIVFAGIIIVTVYKLYGVFWNKNLEVSINFDRDILYEGEENTLREVITNRKYLPIPILQVKFSITRTFLFEHSDNTNVTDYYYRNEFFTVMPFQKITRSYPFRCIHRGLFRMNKMDIIGRSVFLDSKMIESVEHEACVCVLPKRIATVEVPSKVNHLLGEVEKNLHINEDPFTFAGLRDYQPFDNMHSINWKVTARLGELQVNTYNTTFSKKVVLLLNVDANSMSHSHEIIEWAIRITAHLSRVYITKQIPVAMYTNGIDEAQENSVSVEAGADAGHIRTIEVALARLKSDTRPEAFEKLLKTRVVATREPVEYLIISNSRKKELTDCYEGLKAAGCSIHFIVPEYAYNLKDNEESNSKYTYWVVSDEDESISDIRGFY